MCALNSIFAGMNILLNVVRTILIFYLQIFEVLGELSESIYRQVPDIANQITGIEQAKPNLYTSDPQNALSCLTAIFLQRNLVPIANQILVTISRRKNV